MGLFSALFKKNSITNTGDKLAEQSKKEDSSPNTSSTEYLDDITFIRDIKHIVVFPWHQYDILFAARAYGWNTMIDWADYMTQADLDHISQLTTAFVAGAGEKDITASYLKNGGKCAQTPELKTEMGVLSIAGVSKKLKAPLKIIWVNQTRILKLFTLIDDELLIKKYIETMARRTFGTDDEMKLGKPLPEESQK